MSDPSTRRVNFNPSTPGLKRHPNYAEHTHVASLSRRRDIFTPTQPQVKVPPPRFYELRASKTHPGLRARGHYKTVPDNGGAFSARISHPRAENKPRKDGRNIFNGYVESLRRTRIQRQSYALSRSFASMRTMHDITAASPYMSTANRMRGAERTRIKLDLRSYPHTGAAVGYADVQPMLHPPSYTAESFKALEHATRGPLPPSDDWVQRGGPRRTGAGDASVVAAGSSAPGAVQQQASSGLLGAVASVVTGMATNAVNTRPKVAQERQIKEVIRSATRELDSPQKPEVPLCSICLVNEAVMKFHPCQHEATCEECFEVHAKRRGRGKFCPICRSVIYSVEKNGIPYELAKEETPIEHAQSMYPYMGIKSIKLREPREPFVIKESNQNYRVYATLPQINLGM